MLDPEVTLDVATIALDKAEPKNGVSLVQQDQERAKQLGRELAIHSVNGKDSAAEIVRLAHDRKYELVIAALVREGDADSPCLDGNYILKNAMCRVFLTAPPAIPQEPESPPSPAIS
jgi:hypothetical protein